MRTFDSGATRDSADSKPDYHGFNAPIVENAFAKYMHKHRVQADGKMRESSNWQKGMTRQVYLESLCRHIKDLELIHDGYTVLDGETEVNIEDALGGIRFNLNGYWFEHLRGVTNVKR